MKVKYRIYTVKRFKSEYFKCPNCGYSEPRLVKGDVAYSPCPKCGKSPLYRV